MTIPIAALVRQGFWIPFTFIRLWRRVDVTMSLSKN